MKIRLFTLFAIAVAVIAASAAPITHSQALQRAQQSLTLQGITFNAGTASMAAKAPARGGNTETAAYYIFNSSNSFVIASGDDRMPEVLGYSEGSTFDANDIPDGLKDLLECYQVEAARLTGDNDGLPMPNGSISRSPIAPLLKSKWNQNAPYNNLCPIYDGTNRAVTGCVATAMAQVMYYHKWPASINYSIPAYTTKSKGISMPALSASGFPSMSAMTDNYSWDASGTAATAVAKLMLYCGQSLQMDYNKSSGAATANIPVMLSTYFRYASTGRYVRRESYTAEEWASLIYTELAAKRPVVYRGSAYNGGGHSYIVDGIDAGLFHINWGWSGKSDGYFLLTNLNPYDQGAGSSVSNDGYIVGSAMVIGITPENNTISFNDAFMYCTNLGLTTSTYYRSNSGQGFSNVILPCGMYSQYPSTADMDFGIGLYTTSGTLKQVIYSNWYSQLQTGYGSSSAKSCNIPSTITNGTYILKPICRLHNTGSWVPCAGANVNYWQATITSTALSLKLDGNSGNPSYQVNSVTYNGKKETNRTIEMVFNITNKGNNYFRQLYMLVDNKCTTVAQCPIEPSQTGDISLHISAATAGSHSVKLCYDENGQEIMWQSTVYLNEAPAASFLVNSLNVQNASSGKINDNKFAFSVKVTNNNSTSYNDYIEARLYRRASLTSGSMISQIVKEVSIPSRGSQTLSFEFPNLIQNEDYFVNIYYYSNGSATKCGGTSWYTILGASSITGDVNGDGTVDIADVNLAIDIILGLKNKSSYPDADVNGDGKVDVADMNAIINMILGL